MVSFSLAAFSDAAKTGTLFIFLSLLHSQNDVILFLLVVRRNFDLELFSVRWWLWQSPGLDSSCAPCCSIDKTTLQEFQSQLP